jgi:MinD-like ATPase involved in chromosome partitioning or flagellar assembly
MLEVPVLGIVPDDSAVEESLVKKNAVINTKPRSKSAKAYMDIAAKILGKKRKPESMLDKLLGSLGI